MTGKQLINHLCYEYGTKNYNEEKLKAIQEIKKDLEILDMLKHCCQIRRNEILIYITDRTDTDIGNGVEECEAFDEVKEWLER